MCFACGYTTWHSVEGETTLTASGQARGWHPKGPEEDTPSIPENQRRKLTEGRGPVAASVTKNVNTTAVWAMLWRQSGVHRAIAISRLTSENFSCGQKEQQASSSLQSVLQMIDARKGDRPMGFRVQSDSWSNTTYTSALAATWFISPTLDSPAYHTFCTKRGEPLTTWGTYTSESYNLTWIQ